MNIAAMRVRVTFQKNTVIVDKYGTPLDLTGGRFTII